MSMLTTAAVVSAGVGLYGAVNGASGGGGGGSSPPDPFGQYRGQFGSQLSNLFGNGQTPSWLTPGQGMQMTGPTAGALPTAGQGMASTDMLKFDPAQITNDPAYKFQLQQGNNAITANRGALGTGNSGGTLAALSQYNQGLATNFTNQQFGRNLASFNAQNQAQNQNFGQQMGVQGTNFAQTLASMGFTNQAQNQQFGQGNQLASLLAMLSGATQSPATGSNAAFNQQQTNYGNIIGGLGGLGKALGGMNWGSGSGLTSGTGGMVWDGGGW